MLNWDLKNSKFNASTLFLLSTLISLAQTNLFTEGGDGATWEDPMNWSLGHVPDGEDAEISGSDVIVTGNSSPLSVFIEFGSLIIESSAELDVSSSIGLELSNSTLEIEEDGTLRLAGDIRNSQIAVDVFNANTTLINGTLIIGGADIVDLSNLSNLTSVSENLVIGGNNSLTNLDGIAQITSVSGRLIIDDNNLLTNLDGLAKITSISGALWISDNASLINLHGLDQITSVGEYLSIINNINLANCCGIQNLLSTPGAIGGDVTIVDNPSACSSEEEVKNTSCTISATNEPNSKAEHLFQVFPIPTKDNLQINLDRNYAQVIVNVISITGQIISTNKYNHVNQVQLYLTQEPGLYLLGIRTSDGHVELSKIIIE